MKGDREAGASVADVSIPIAKKLKKKEPWAEAETSKWVSRLYEFWFSIWEFKRSRRTAASSLSLG